jgi:hypothetical protein
MNPILYARQRYWKRDPYASQLACSLLVDQPEEPDGIGLAVMETEHCCRLAPVGPPLLDTISADLISVDPLQVEPVQAKSGIPLLILLVLALLDGALAAYELAVKLGAIWWPPCPATLAKRPVRAGGGVQRAAPARAVFPTPSARSS